MFHNPHKVLVFSWSLSFSIVMCRLLVEYLIVSTDQWHKNVLELEEASSDSRFSAFTLRRTLGREEWKVT